MILIHGAGIQNASEGSGSLAEYLARTLGDEMEVIAPPMPSPAAPRYVLWRDRIVELLEVHGPDVCLVGHSIGGSILLKYLSEEGAGRRVAGLFLAAAPYWGMPEWEVPEYTLREGYARRLHPEVPIFLYHSDDDRVVPIEHALRFSREVPGSTLRPLNDRGHDFRAGLPELVEDLRALRAVPRRSPES